MFSVKNVQQLQMDIRASTMHGCVHIAQVLDKPLRVSILLCVYVLCVAAWSDTKTQTHMHAHTYMHA